MARVSRGVQARARHKKVLKKAKGYYGARSRVYRVATQAVTKAEQYAYRDRKQKKRTFRQLWIARINAEARMNGLSYSVLMHGLNKAGVSVDRKMLADIAVHDKSAFAQIVEQAKVGLSTDSSPKKTEAKASAPKKATAKKTETKAAPKKAAAKKSTAKKTDDMPAGEGSKPTAFTPSDDNPADNLEDINGIGPKIHGILNDLGIYTFAQIADFTQENSDWVNNSLSFKGRIEREEWIKQAKVFVKK